jgi:hypothetical protein
MVSPVKRIHHIIFLSSLIVLQASAQISQGSRSYSKDAAISFSGGTVHIVANSPRPLEQMLDALQQKYGWAINYEDPQYISPMDILTSPGGDSSLKLPAGGTFTVEFSATAPEEEKILRLVVDSYNQSKNPGRFELRHDPQGNFRVVGTAARDEKGTISAQPVVLDLPLTLTTEERSIADTVNLICEGIAAQNKTPVAVGISPRALMNRTLAKVGGTKIPAHDLLAESLTATRHNLYWRLLFDPDSKSYFLGIHSSR